MKKLILIAISAFSINAFAQPGYITYTNSSVDVIQVPPNATLNFQGDFTMSLKVKFTNVAFWNMLFNYDTYGGLEFSYTGANLVFTADGSTINATHVKPWSPVNNQWYHIVLTKQGNVYTSYIDGVLLGTSTHPASIPNYSAKSFRIGKYMSPGLYFMGNMDDVSIWNIALSPTFISTTLPNPLLGNESGLILYYNMDTTGAGQGITVRNKAQSTGNALNGTTAGTATSPFFTSLATGIPSASYDNGFTIYPNPFNTVATLKLNSAAALKNAELKIYDVLGKEVKKIPVNATEITISREDLENGIYFYTLINNEEIIASGKLIIQ